MRRPILTCRAVVTPSTGAAGFAWDHDIFAGGDELRYAQWRAWMRVLAALREAHPDLVMDHRQTNHKWGPWCVRAVRRSQERGWATASGATPLLPRR